MTSGRNRIECEWLFEPRDCWIGLYWKRYPNAIEIYLCLLPMVPFRVHWKWGK
jgi:hypothetical protein